MGINKQNGIVTMMRGDSLTMTIPIPVGSSTLPSYRGLRLTEKLYFGVMEPNQAFEDAVLKKVIDASCVTDDNGYPVLILDPEDTEYLLVGKYYYMIKLREVDSYGHAFVKTIVPPTLFWLEGNNPELDVIDRHETDEYKVDNVIIEGGEIIDNTDAPSRVIIFDGGEII